MKFDDQTAAFAVGLPFFITDVTFDGTSTLRFTVFSNPDIKIESALAGAELRSGSANSLWTDPSHSFGSSPQAQNLTFDMHGEKPGEGRVLSILKEISQYNYCLLSNQVDLGSLKSP